MTPVLLTVTSPLFTVTDSWKEPGEVQLADLGLCPHPQAAHCHPKRAPHLPQEKTLFLHKVPVLPEVQPASLRSGVGAVCAGHLGAPSIGELPAPVYSTAREGHLAPARSDVWGCLQVTLRGLRQCNEGASHPGPPGAVT